MIELTQGVQIFLELKSRISDELKPDFLLVDSRTGITEMGGVATTLLPDKVICLVLPTLENIWQDPEAALKEVEELAESFGHPENYRALLRFYEVRNVSGPQIFKRAQRLWENTQGLERCNTLAGRE